MGDNFYSWLGHHFFETYGLLCFLFHAIWFLLKIVRPPIEEGRSLFLYIKSWKSNEEERALSKAEPKT